jgi:hypothetical protein
MNSPISAFNPARFNDQIDEALYATAWGLGARLKRERKDLIDWLRKKAKDDKLSLALADKLDRCKPHARCKSAACPECSHAARELVTEVTRQFLKERPSSGTIACLSIVPADVASKPGTLTKDQHARNVRRWKEALGRAGVTWFIGGSDWSFNEHDEDRYPGHWSHHLYGFAATTDLEQLKKALQQQFPRTDVIPRPVKVQEWDGKKRPIRYMVKSKFWRRIGTDDGERFDKTNGGQRPCRATDKQPLPSSRRRELLLHLDEIGLQGRLVMRWLQILHLGGAGSAVVERGPKRSAAVSVAQRVLAVVEHGFRPWLSAAQMAVCARSAESASWAVGLASWSHRSRLRWPVFNELHFELLRAAVTRSRMNRKSVRLLERL